MVIVGNPFEYSQYVTISGRHSEPISGIVKVDLYRDEQEILHGFVRSKAEQKIEYYSNRITEMNQKYGMDYQAFQNRVYLRAAEIDLEEWNDLVLWGGYVKAYRYWAQFC
ncbi:MAG: hypothetical protein ACOX7X_10565 [Methanosarcina flavescens]